MPTKRFSCSCAVRGSFYKCSFRANLITKYQYDKPMYKKTDTHGSFDSLFLFIHDQQRIQSIFDGLPFTMVQLFFKSEFDRCSFKKRVNKKIIVRSCLLEDLVCIPTEKQLQTEKHTFTFIFRARNGRKLLQFCCSYVLS